MSDKKISQLPASTIPLAGTEEFPLVQSGVTKKVTINNVTTDRTVLFDYAAGTPVQILRDAAGASLKAINLDQPNTTDGNALAIDYRTTTTGSNVENNAVFASLRMKAVTHDWSTRRADLEVYLAKGGVGTPKVLTVDPDNLTLNRGNLVIGTAGKGIDFSADGQAAGMTSELLDDYEEGTWTPTLTTSGTDFDSVTYGSLRGGRYTKVGNLVHIQAYMITDAVTVGSASGNVRIGGLPFISVNHSSGTADGSAPLSVGQVSNWAGEMPLEAVVVNNSTSINLLYRSAVDGASIVTAIADVGATASDNIIRIAGTYIAA